uniref:Uncharacterized protein n=1 Tax=Timema tahoe TaxID=61484 RepID=A0A7R9NY94_9NEOP|nr:unnamed protein product [Timema tahoe]
MTATNPNASITSAYEILPHPLSTGEGEDKEKNSPLFRTCKLEGKLALYFLSHFDQVVSSLTRLLGRGVGRRVHRDEAEGVLESVTCQRLVKIASDISP